MTLTVQTDRRQKVAAAAYRMRHYVLNMGEAQGQGYVGQALGAADMLAGVYADQLRYRAEDPHWEGRDRFLLSTGHYAIGLYAALAEAGIIAVEELDSYGSDGSRLPMSGMASYTPGMEISGGSLGHGLTVAVGMALGLRHQGSSSRIFNFLSDGELDEGSTWEAAISASHHRLGNLTALVDINALQADGPTAGVLRIEPVTDNWEACGWFVRCWPPSTTSPLSSPSPGRRRSSCATPGSAAGCRCWKPGRKRTSCASTPTNGNSAATNSPQATKKANNYEHVRTATHLGDDRVVR